MRKRYAMPRARRRKTGAAKALLIICAAAAVFFWMSVQQHQEYVIGDGGTKRAVFVKSAIDCTLRVTPVFRARESVLTASGQVGGQTAATALSDVLLSSVPRSSLSAEQKNDAPPEGGSLEGEIIALSAEAGVLSDSLSEAVQTEDAAPPENSYKIEDVTLCPKSAEGYTAYDGVYIINSTKFRIDPESLLSAPLPFSYNPNEMQVLIIHTHATESYSPDGAAYYGENDSTRTLDCDKNVVRVGEEMRRVLESRGINVYHDMTVHDYPSYNGSYTRALETINARLAEYPSIKIVLDVHRDAIIDSDNTKYRPVTEYGGVRFAQMLLCMGSSEGGLEHKDWQTNLSFAVKLQKKLCGAVPDLMRPVALKKERYNQHATPGSLIIEVGSDGNSLEEALASARLFAQATADVLKGE
ncbi:MAG: stage II sporulation protein P [Clostridia bacterium]|nr:stage II sporulation protein P [Clostridia bacterium]